MHYLTCSQSFSRWFLNPGFRQICPLWEGLLWSKNTRNRINKWAMVKRLCFLIRTSSHLCFLIRTSSLKHAYPFPACLWGILDRICDICNTFVRASLIQIVGKVDLISNVNSLIPIPLHQKIVFCRKRKYSRFQITATFPLDQKTPRGRLDRTAQRDH